MNSTYLYEFIKNHYHKELTNLINLIKSQNYTIDITICHNNHHLPLFPEHSVIDNFIHILSNNYIYDSNGNLMFLIGLGYTNNNILIKSGINSTNINNYEINPHNGINLFNQIKNPFTNIYNEYLSIQQLNFNFNFNNNNNIQNTPLIYTNDNFELEPSPSPLPSPSIEAIYEPLPLPQLTPIASIYEPLPLPQLPSISNTTDTETTSNQPIYLHPLESIDVILSIAELNPYPDTPIDNSSTELIPNLVNEEDDLYISDTDSMPGLIDNISNIITPNNPKLVSPFTFSEPYLNKYFKLKNTYPLEHANDLQSAIKKLNQLINQKNILLDRAPTMDNSILGIDVNLYIVSLCQDDKGWSIRIGKNLIDSTYSTKSYITNTDYSYISYLLIPS